MRCSDGIVEAIRRLQAHYAGPENALLLHALIARKKFARHEVDEATASAAERRNDKETRRAFEQALAEYDAEQVLLSAEINALSLCAAKPTRWVADPVVRPPGFFRAAMTRVDTALKKALCGKDVFVRRSLLRQIRDLQSDLSDVYTEAVEYALFAPKQMRLEYDEFSVPAGDGPEGPPADVLVYGPGQGRAPRADPAEAVWRRSTRTVEEQKRWQRRARAMRVEARAAAEAVAAAAEAAAAAAAAVERDNAAKAAAALSAAKRAIAEAEALAEEVSRAERKLAAESQLDIPAIKARMAAISAFLRSNTTVIDVIVAMDDPSVSEQLREFMEKIRAQRLADVKDAGYLGRLRDAANVVGAAPAAVYNGLARIPGAAYSGLANAPLVGKYLMRPEDVAFLGGAIGGAIGSFVLPWARTGAVDAVNAVANGAYSLVTAPIATASHGAAAVATGAVSWLVPERAKEDPDPDLLLNTIAKFRESPTLAKPVVVTLPGSLDWVIARSHETEEISSRDLLVAGLEELEDISKMCGHMVRHTSQFLGVAGLREQATDILNRYEVAEVEMRKGCVRYRLSVKWYDCTAAVSESPGISSMAELLAAILKKFAAETRRSLDQMRMRANSIRRYLEAYSDEDVECLRAPLEALKADAEGLGNADFTNSLYFLSARIDTLEHAYFKDAQSGGGAVFSAVLFSLRWYFRRTCEVSPGDTVEVLEGRVAYLQSCVRDRDRIVRRDALDTDIRSVREVIRDATQMAQKRAWFDGYAARLRQLRYSDPKAAAIRRTLDAFQTATYETLVAKVEQLDVVLAAEGAPYEASVEDLGLGRGINAAREGQVVHMAEMKHLAGLREAALEDERVRNWNPEFFERQAKMENELAENKRLAEERWRRRDEEEAAQQKANDEQDAIEAAALQGSFQAPSNLRWLRAAGLGTGATKLFPA